MDSAKPVITYEVHIKRKGQWEVHVRYPENRKVQAMGKAKSMARDSDVEEVRVVEESYDPSAGSSSERTIYSVDCDKPNGKPDASRADTVPPSPTSTSRDGGHSPIGKTKKKSKVSKASDATAKKTSKKRGGKPRKMTAVAFFTRLLLVLLFSIVIGMTFVGLASVIMRRTSLESTAQVNILFIVFIVAFLISVVSMTISLLSKTDFKSRSASQKTAPTASEPIPVTANVAADDKGIDGGEEALTKEQIDAAEKAAKALAESMRSKEKDETEKQSEEKDAKDNIVSPLYEKQKAFASEFFDNVFKPSADKLDFKKMDNFNKFGVNLFIAGACEAQGQKRNIDGRTTIKLISEGVQALGFKETEANSFAEKYPEYLVADSRYMQMFQAGRNSMNTYISGDDGVELDMKKAIDEWNEPKAKEESASPVTVMFTDMVGSTALTQTRGDAIAQNVVHVHNRIVRDSLRQYLGKEIKHTGDGIMASFSNTSNGVEASIAIQKKVAAHNQSNPDLPLHLKIGINVGEPISEDNDLFGTTVQLSARIVDKAKSEQIFVSEAVRGICAGKSINFASGGSFDMKGFADPITLYEVIWQEDPNAVKEQPAASAPVTEKPTK